MLDYILIGMVFDEPLTGYDIKKEIEAGIGNFYKASYGSLYPALKKLTEKEYLTMTERPQGARVKKYYEATELGRSVFLAWLSAPFDPRVDGDALLAMIYFYGVLPEDIRNRRLEEHELHLRQVLGQLQAIEKSVLTSHAEKEDYFMVSTLYYGIQNVHVAIRWIRYIRDQKPLTEFVRE